MSDVAHRLLDSFGAAFPHVTVDREAVLFGAATHDIGKAIHRDELVGPGQLHETAGEALLLERGIAAAHARFARTHAAWDRDVAGLEDLLVALADKIWKGRREQDLEKRVVDLVTSDDVPNWDAFGKLDAILEDLGELADDRLAFQARFAVR